MGSTNIEYREPGTGAIEFARPFVEGLTREHALPFIRRLLRGELHDTTDERIKRCAYCGYFFRDKTRPNNAKTCSHECKVARDTLNRAMRRADEALLNPKRKTKRDELYASELEYPFWLDEHEMFLHSYKYEPSFDYQHLEMIAAARQRAERMGGRRKPKYEATEEKQYIVRVRFAKYEEARKPSPIKTWYMPLDELDRYLSERYPDKFSRSKKDIVERAIF